MRRVGIAELKARLSEHLRYVRRGHVVTVFHRDTPIARVVPHDRMEATAVQAPSGRVRRFQDVPLPTPPAACVHIDVLELLVEERQRR